MKKYILFSLFILLIILGACTQVPSESTPKDLENYHCKDTPLAAGCYIPSSDLNHISPITEEYLINEIFDGERVGSVPRNWLLYRNEEYSVNGVIARIAEESSGNKYVEMYSDGLKVPIYPQNAPLPTYIFTSNFNLDIARKGVAYASVMMPSNKTSNAFAVGLATGSVNSVSVVVNKEGMVSIKLGGGYFYYSQSGDGGITVQTSLKLNKDNWYNFKFEWDGSENLIKVFHIIDDQENLLYSGEFHESNRVNSLENGAILVPNIFRVTMPRASSGWAYLDNVIVERKGE